MTIACYHTYPIACYENFVRVFYNVNIFVVELNEEMSLSVPFEKQFGNINEKTETNETSKL